MANYLDQYKEYLSQSYKLISDIGLEFALSIDDGEFNNSTLSELLGYVFFGRNVLDLQATEDQRLDPLTAMVNQAPLLPVPIPLGYLGNINIYPPSIPPLLSHSQLLNILGPGELHLDDTLLNKLVSLPFNYGWDDIVGNNPLINAPLAAIISGLEPAFPASGNPARYLNGTKAFSQVQFSHLGGVPTTLAGYGISSSDTLFDGRYLRTNTVLSTYSLGSNTPLNNTQSIVQMFGNVQGQINAREAALGNPSTNGYILSSTTAGVRSWVPFAGGGTLNSVSINGLNGFAGTAVVTAGNAAITLRTSITGLLKGNGTAISAATEMTDYIGITGATNGDTILFTGGVATWAPGLSNPMTLLGDLIIGGASGATTGLAGNTTTTRKFLMSVGASGAALAQTYETLLAGDIPNIAISQVTNLQATLDGYLPDALANGMLFIGNVSDVAVNAIVTGDLTATYVDNSGTNEAEFTIANEAVTYAKIQNVTSQTLLGRFALADGVVQQLTLNGSDFTINSSTGVIGLVTPNSPILTTKGDILTHTGAAQARLGIGANATFFMADTAATTGNKWVAMSGDATIAVSGALTIAAGAVTLAKMANMATNSFIGRISASTGVPEILTATQATSLLNLFSSSAKGLAPVVTGAAIGDATYFLNATGTWTVPAGGGGSGTVTSIATAGLISGGTITTTGTITTSMATNKLVGRGTAGTGIMEEITLGTGLSLTGNTLNATGGGIGTVTSVDLTMPTAFSVTGNPITTSGTLAVTGAGTASQYVRGDGTLANFPTSGGGGASLSYYLNGSVASSVAGYEQMNRVPVIGAGTDYTLNNTSALMAQFVTDANDPSLLNIPAGSWDINAYFSASNNSGSPTFYVELLKYDTATTTFTSIATGSTELIDLGTTIHLYTTSISVPSTALTVTDRLVIRVYVNTAGSRTITFHTEGPHLAQIITTFTTGLTAFNGLIAQVQFLGAVGTTGNAPAWTSTTATHTLDIPLANAGTGVTAGLISNTEFNIFNDKMSNPMTAEGDIIYGGTVTGGVAAPTVLPIGSNGKVLTVVSGVPAWGTVPSMTYPAAGIANSTGTSWGTSYTTTGSGTVLALATSPTFVTPVLGAATGTSLDVTGALTSGVASTTAGTLVLRNASSAFTQTIRGTNPAASIIYDLPTTAPTAGQVLSSSAPSAGVATLSWATVASGSTALSAITAAAAGNTIANADFAQVWNWATLAANTALTLGSVGVTSGTILSVTHSTSALTGNLVNIASTGNVTTGRLLNISSVGTTMTSNTHAGAFISLTGASAAASVTTTGIDVTNTRTGTTSVNIGGRFTATGGTTNYPLISVNAVTSGLHDLVSLVGRQAAANDAASVSFYSNSLSSANRVVSLKSLFSNPGYNFVLDLFGNTAITEALRIVGTLDAMNMGFGTNAPTAKFHLKHTGTGASLGNISQGMMLLESVSQTNIAIGSEVNGVNFNFTATKGFAATAGTRVTTNQREFLVSAPTYNASTSAYVITNAATMAITAAPTASTNITFTNTAMALWVQAGLVRFDGDLIVGASAVTPSARLQVRGASGANTAFLVQVNNTTTKVIEAGSTGGGAATLGLYGVTPIVRPTDANQGAITDSTGGTASFTLVDVGAVPTQANINDNFASINRQLAAIRTGLVNLGAITGS